jgi:hypothetical protein
MSMNEQTAAQWTMLERHFAHHAVLINRFRGAGPSDIVSMWETQRNEAGDPLSQLEREALVERHCEVFGSWPT